MTPRQHIILQTSINRLHDIEEQLISADLNFEATVVSNVAQTLWEQLREYEDNEGFFD